VLAAGYFLFRQARPSDLPLEESQVANPDDLSESAGDLPVFVEASPDAPVVSTSASVSPSPTGADKTADEAVVISITDTGFVPDQVTVDAGTTVTFVNNGQALHWPASDLHPTHQILPDFDAKRGLSTGETYSYTFTQSGTWSMHDHLNPSSAGTITVK